MSQRPVQNNQNEPVIEFKVNDSLLTRNAFNPMNQQMMPSAYVPIQNKFLPNGYPYVQSSAYGMPQTPYHFVPNNVPIIKNYNLSVPNPSGDHLRYADIYEDAMPTKNGVPQNSSITLDERYITYQYVRDTIVKTSDGEEISINTKLKDTHEKDNLLSHIKLLDFQPYHTNKISKNPYTHANTDKMYIYNSCWPQRYNESRGNLECYRYSISMNLRIYDMSIAEYNVKRLEDFEHNEFNLWREVVFYQYVKKEILNKKMCPNFPILFTYFLSSGAAINFGKLKEIKRTFNLRRNKAAVKLEQKYKKKYQKILDRDNGRRYDLSTINGEPTKQYMQKSRNEYLLDTKKSLEYLRKQNKVDLDGSIKKPISDKSKKELDLEYKRDQFRMKQITDSMDKCLLVLTEAPNYNIIQWASKTYQAKPLGPVKSATISGFHHKSEWMSVIFQLMAALQTMYIKKFTFVDMQLENNVYIKDLKNQEQVMGYWKYVINDISYYVPNEGFLLLIDSDFREVSTKDEFLLANPKNEDDTDEDDNEYYKMYGKVDSNFVNNPTKEMTDKLDELQYENLKNLLSDDNFSLKFKNYGGITPNTEILSMLSQIKTDLENRSDGEKNGNLSDIFINNRNVQKYLHNRVGTFLTSDEKNHVIEISDSQITNVNELKKGNLYPLLQPGTGDNYKWVIFIEEDISGQIIIYDRDINRNIFKNNSANITDFRLYNAYEPDQEYKSDLKFTEFKQLEQYIINNNDD